MANREWSMPELLSKAQSYCAAAEHCSFEVQQKLRQWEATPLQMEKVLDSLKSDKFIDEQRYCNAFVHDKLLYQGWGRVKIRAALQAKRLPEHAISTSLENIDEIGYFRILERLIAQKKSARPEQIVRFCLQRGFTYDEIRRYVSF